MFAVHIRRAASVNSYIMKVNREGGVCSRNQESNQSCSSIDKVQQVSIVTLGQEDC